MEQTSLEMVINTLVNIYRADQKVVVSTNGTMEISILVNFQKARSLEKESGDSYHQTHRDRRTSTILMENINTT